LQTDEGSAIGWSNPAGNVLGLYLHGLFEDPAVLGALFGATAPTLDSVFDGLADFIERHVQAGVLDQLASADPPLPPTPMLIDLPTFWSTLRHTGTPP
jgi:cobyric acid synthase